MFARVLLPLLCLPGVWADWNNTSTGIDLDKLPHPALTKLHTGGIESGKRLEFDGITALSSVNEVVLQGKSKSGRSWTLSMCARCLQEVWRGDLDGNGTPDYVIAGVGPYDNGRRTPPASLSFLLMDPDGVPAPFFTPIDRENGIQNLVKLDGQIRLLISRYDEIPSDARVDWLCSGHWVTQAYSFTNRSVEEVRGVFAGKRFPFVHNWVHDDPECAHHPVGFSDGPKLIELGTSAKGALTAAPAGCDPTVSESIMLDSRAGREIALPNPSSDSQNKLIRKILAAQATVELRGVQDCSITLMWARSSP